MTAPSLRTTADELARLALAAERRHPFSTPDHRVIQYVIDETPANVYPRLQLFATAKYTTFIEGMCFYGRGSVGRKVAEKTGSGLHVEFECWLEGERYPLTEDEADELLATGELPVPRRRLEDHVSAGQPSDPFEGFA